jgi:hypothetical protein
MIDRTGLLRRCTNLLAVAAALLAAVAAYAQAPEQAGDVDPPTRVARMSYMSGEVSFSPAGNEEWVQASLNRPIVPGDRLWADRDARAELSVDNSTWWLGEQTSVTVSNLDDRIVQVQLQQGTLDVRVRRLAEGNIVEIDTPNLAFSVTQPGRYRVEVDPQGGATAVVVRSGSGEVYGEGASYVIASGQAYRFYGTDLQSETLAPPPVDAVERFALERDRRYDRVASARYVSSEVIGYEDLDSYGSWSSVGTYGNVWFPRVSAGWAPYRDGHWAWIDPWGWTWVDEQPWGFAPFHYGRWAYVDRGWCWVPGPRTVRPVYAPALVAFFGGAGVSISVSSGPAIGWFPLGPREVYVPAYSVSRNYFRQVNVSNTVINNTTIINNYYNNPTRVTQVNYVNARVPNAVTAVPPAAFAQAQNVRRAAIAVPAAAVERVQVQPVARVAPARTALLGASPVAQAKPPAATVQRAVVAKAAPPPPPVPDAQKLQALEKNPGKPLNRGELQTLRRAAPPATTAQPAVKVVEQAKPAPRAAPPAHAPTPAGRAAGPGGPSQGQTAAPSAAPGAAPKGPEAKGPARGPEAKGPEAKGPEAKGPPGSRPQESIARPPQTPQPEAKGPPARGPEARGPEPKGPEAKGPPPTRAPESVARPPQGAQPEAKGPPARGPEARGPEPRGPEAKGPPPTRAPESVARPPQGAQPEAKGPPASRERDAKGPPQQRTPEAKGPPATRGPESVARPPQREPQARPEPQREPQARPQPQQRAPEARPQPQGRPEAQRAPEARPQPQTQRTPEARPQPPRPPEAQPRPPAREAPAERGKGKDKDKDKDEKG